MDGKNHLRSLLLALAGGAALLALAPSTASAQFYPRPYFGGGYYYPGDVVIPRRRVGMPIGEIFEELEQRGYRPQGVVGRRGDVVIVNALDPRRQPVRLIVDAFDGEILERFAREVATATPPASLPAGPPSSLNPDPRRNEAEKLKREPGRTAELPAPPRRAADAAEPPRTAPVAPARPPSEWLPPDLAQPKQ